MKTNSKEFTAKINAYILDAISAEGYSETVSSDSEKLHFLASCFKSEFLFPANLKRYGSYQRCFAEWIQGLPSSFDIAFWNDDIVRIAKRMGSLPENATDKQEQRVIENWFNLVSAKTMMLFEKHNINLR